MQLDVMCNLSYATTQICSCICRMQLNFSCKKQLQNPKFLVVTPKSVGECEGMSPHTPKWAPTLGVKV